MTKLTKNEKILRKGNEKWKNFLAEGAFKKTVNESIDFNTVHFAGSMEPEELALLNIPEEEYKTKSKEEVEAIVAAVEKAHEQAQYGVELRSTATRAENEPIMRVINSKMKAGYKLTGEKGYSHSSGAEEDEEYRMTYSNDMPSRDGELKEWDEDDTYHFDVDKGGEEEYTAAANFEMGDVVKVMNRGKPRFDEPEELRCRVGTVTGMDGRDLTLKFENGEEATITYFNASKNQDLWNAPKLFKCPEEQVSEARMGEYGKIDAEDGNPPTKIGRGNEEYMAAYNAVLQARGEEPLEIQKPDQAFLDALRSGQLQEVVRKVVTKVLTEKKKFKLKESNMEMSLQSKAKGKAMGLLQTAKAMAQAPSTEPAKGFAAAVANAAGEIVDLMVELEGFQASRLDQLDERDAGMEVWMEKFKLHARLPQNQPMDEFMKDNAMYAYRQGMDPKQAAEELRAASAERDFPESGMELYDIDEKKSIKEEVIEDFEIELEGGITFADVEEAGLVTPGVDSVIDNGDGYAQVYSEPEAMAKMAKTLEAMTGVMVTPKSHGPVDERSKDDERDLEKPVKYGSGAELEFDKKAQKFYDRKRDMYLDDPEEEDNLIKEKDQKEFAKVKAIATDMMVLSARSRIKPTLGSVQSALDVQKIPSQMEDNKLIVADKYVVAEKNILPETAESLSFTRYAIDYLSNLPGEQQDLPIG